MPQPITCIEDLRLQAARRLPRMLFDFVDRGSWFEHTLRRNRQDLDAIALRQRVGCAISTVSCQTSLLGVSQNLPLAIAPTGMSGFLYPDGEIHAARAALKKGLAFTLSLMSTCSMEAVSEAVQGRPFHFQLSIFKDRGLSKSLMERAKAIGCSALVLTLDLHRVGKRFQDLKNGLSLPPRSHFKNLLSLASHPSWLWGMRKARHRSFGNLEGQMQGLHGPAAIAQWAQQQLAVDVSWHDVAWVREHWAGKLIVKGVLDAEDAELALSAGADAIIVSNHGGRQLDGTCSTIQALPSIVQRIQQRAEVYMDGGISSGQHVFKALALGAQAVYLGRAHLYGLAAAGQAGVEQAIELLQEELMLTMALCGCPSLAEAHLRQATLATTYLLVSPPSFQRLKGAFS